MENEIVEVKEYKTQIDFVQSKANELVISSDEDMSLGSDLLNDLKLVEKSIKEKKESITRPLMTGLSNARNLFKPLEESYASAKSIIKAKMLEFSIAEEERIAKEKARVEARVEKGTMRVDTAVDKMENIGEVKNSFEGTSSKTSIRKVTKIRITNESLIPREYLIPDLKGITEAVLRDGKIIAGVEKYFDKSIVSLTR